MSALFVGILILTILVSTCYASVFEWLLHRDLMHKPLRTPFGKFDYPFRAHALTHHRIFKSDYTYHLQHDADKHTIPMAWWNGPLLILVGTASTVPISILLHRWWMSLVCMIVFILYYAAYEYIHWCMHLPEEKQRLIEKNWLFSHLNGRHLLHHHFPNKNFNVVLPCADLLFGTYLGRSKVRFIQATGPSVPDVQPRNQIK